MEKLYRAQIPLRKTQDSYLGADNPIEYDNKPLNIYDGDSKMLDYLDYSGTIAKGTLAAEGIIKLCPKSFEKYKKDFGAIAPPNINKQKDNQKEPGFSENDFENEWDNIFLIKSDTSESPFNQTS